MNPQHLIDMANRIGDFYVHMPDAPQAQHDMATHLRKFWDPRMRHSMWTALHSDEAQALQPFVRDTLVTCAEVWAPEWVNAPQK